MIHINQINKIKSYMLPKLVKFKLRQKMNGHISPEKNKKILGNSIEKRSEHINNHSKKDIMKLM